jgi:hypothetical protein
VNATRPLARAGAALAAAALAVIFTPVPSAARNANRVADIRMVVDSVAPLAPVASQNPRPLVVTLTLTNTSSAPYKDVEILGERGDPIGSQDALDRALASVSPPTSGGLPIAAHTPVTVDLQPQESKTVTFETTTSIQVPDEHTGICICHEGLVYPLFFSAHVTGENGADQLLGVAATYVPAFDTKPKPLHVSWVWPLLERPHRLADDTVFTDDLLATSVDTGRLSRALAVVEQVAAEATPKIPITLLIDPDLLDELEVMASTSTPYTVRTSDGRTVPGAGQQAARTWLDRLHGLLVGHAEVQVELTPFGDPDVEALTRSGLTWTNTMPASTGMSRRVSDALAGRPASSTLLWPATGAVSRPTLNTLATKGVGTVVLNSAAVRPTAPAGSLPGLARLQVNRDYDIIAPLTSTAVEKYVAQAVTVNGRGAAALPQLTAELAVRVTQEPDVEHAITITPPRYVDPDVAAAVQTIEDTSESPFAEPISVSDAVNGPLVPTGSTRLAKPGNLATSPDTLTAAATATVNRRVINSLLDRTDPGVQTFENNLPIAIQRCESAAWREPSNAQASAQYAHDLTASVDSITSGVHIVRPSAGSYTLASNSSPLPITIDNELRYPVWVRLDITTDPPGVLGFRSRDIGKQHVDAGSKRTLNIPTTTERTGRIPIKAVLLSPNGDPLGDPIKMTVRSTALGAIGIVITVVAGVVLALALLWRFARRLHGRRTADLPPGPIPADDPAPVP